jgi:hypothetical protein
MALGDDTSWDSFEWFVLRATGMPFEWVQERGDEPVWLLSSRGYNDRMSESRTRLWELTKNPLFREAVFMSNPQVHGFLDAWRASFEPTVRKRKDRKRERTLYRFLTRFTAKNDTTSFFGATSLGRLDKARTGDLNLPVADVRKVFLEHWAAQALLDAIGQALDLSVSDTVLPVGHPRVFEYLSATLATAPPSDEQIVWEERVNTLRKRFKDFETAAYDERIPLFRSIESNLREWLQTQTRRGEGQYYASKTVLHEVGDRSGEVVGLRPEERQRLTQSLSPAMDFCALHVLVERLKTRAYLQPHLAEGPLPFADVVDMLAKAGPQFHLQAPPKARELYAGLAAMRTHMRERIDAHLSADATGTLELCDDVVSGFMETWRAALDATGRAYTNPDILLTSDDEPTLVLGDMHAMPFLTPAAYAAAPREEEAWEATRTFLASLCAPELPAFLTHQRPSFVAYVPDLGEVSLEIDGRACGPTERRSTLNSLSVELRDEDFAFTCKTPGSAEEAVMPLTRAANVMSRYSKALQSMARVYPIKLFALGEWLAGPGWLGTGDLPRLSFAGVIVHRRCWLIASRDWVGRGADGQQAFLRLAEVTEGQLPRFCYVKSGADPKPLLVDLSDPMSAELLLWMARNEASLTLTEMLPASEELWLKGPGGHYNSELRTVFVR